MLKFILQAKVTITRHYHNDTYVTYLPNKGAAKIAAKLYADKSSPRKYS